MFCIFHAQNTQTVSPKSIIGTVCKKQPNGVLAPCFSHMEGSGKLLTTSCRCFTG